MKGIARTVVQLIYGNGLQRWLLGIGLILTLLGTVLRVTWRNAALQGLFAVTALLGVAIAAISPIVVGVVMFRALSAARSVQLIPHGQLKLIQGAFSAQLLLALFMALSVSTLVSGSVDRLRGQGVRHHIQRAHDFFRGFLLGTELSLRRPPMADLHTRRTRALPGVSAGTSGGAAADADWTARDFDGKRAGMAGVRDRLHQAAAYHPAGLEAGRPRFITRARRTPANPRTAGAERYERKQAVRVLLIGVADIEQHTASSCSC